MKTKEMILFMFSSFKMAEIECTVIISKTCSCSLDLDKGSLDYELRFQFKCKDHPQRQETIQASEQFI